MYKKKSLLQYKIVCKLNRLSLIYNINVVISLSHVILQIYAHKITQMDQNFEH